MNVQQQLKEMYKAERGLLELELAGQEIKL